MTTLSGIIDYSMGNFLCIRGFSSYKLLSKVSDCDTDVQRSLIPKHKEDIAAYLNKGEFRFFPEIILSTSLQDNDNYDEVSRFFETMRSKGEWGRKQLGKFNISIFRHETKERNRLAQISFYEYEVKLKRIDGNHRLSAANEVEGDFTVPFCLVLTPTDLDLKVFSTAIFHNINAKQIPLNLEENLKVILRNKEIFPDDKLKTDNSFGWAYYLARKILEDVDFGYFKNISFYIEAKKNTFFVELFKYLINNKTIEESEESIDIIKSQFVEIEKALSESGIVATTTNIAVIGALAIYKLSDHFKYRAFLSWIKMNNIGTVENLHIDDVVRIYNEIYEHIPKKAFLARWYPGETDPELSNANHRLRAIKEVVENDLHLSLTDLGTRDTGTFDIREVMYRDIRECDIFIADLSGARHNVMIEVGYALKHMDTVRMVFYFQETENCKTVPFDVSHLSYDKITDSNDIRSKTKARIRRILEQAKTGEI